MKKGESLEQSKSSKDLPSVAAVVVTRNRCEQLLRMLSQTRELDYPKEMLDIFLLDNASTDETVEKVREVFPEIHVRESSTNVGPTGGWNIGIKQVLEAERSYKYIWLLDSDAEIEDQTLISLVEAAEKDPQIGVVGSAVYEPNKRDQLITAGLNIDWKKPQLFYHIPKPEEAENLFDVGTIPACSSITRTDLYKKLGILDDRLWLYCGDTEWCVRVLRNGYRVCCLGKSRVWHRSWVNIKPDFHFPYALHGRVCSELLFHYLYNKEHSSVTVRNLIMKSYVKAAFENFTLRPNFCRAYEEGVKDFFDGNYSKEQSPPWVNDLKLSEITEICRGLSEKISRSPRIILNQIPDDSQKAEIKKVFGNYFDKIKWEEIPVRKGNDSIHASDRLHEYLFFHVPQFFLRVLLFNRRRDVIISPVALGCIYNVAAARYTILLDGSLCGCFTKNRLFKSAAKVFMTIIRGFKAVYFDFPHALKYRKLKDVTTYCAFANREDT